VDSTFQAFGGAINDLFHVLKERPDLGEAHYILGALNLKRGWKYGAWEEWKTYTTLCPGTALAEETEASLDTIEMSMSTRLQNAISVWEGYVQAVRENDREKAERNWSKEARQRYRAFDWQMPDFEKAVDLVSNNYLAIADLKEQEDYIELLIASPGRKSTYYLIRERGSTLLANPVEVLTRGWQKRETKNFVCHYRKGYGPSPLQLRRLDKFYREISLHLDVTLDRKIDYYKCDSPEEVGKLLGMAPATGLGYYPNCVVTAMGWSSFHEVVHVLLGQTCRKQPVSLILEGAACYFGGSNTVTREAQLSWAKTLLENKESLPISRISRERAFWSAEDMNDPYAQAASFVGFLVETYGISKFKELYKYRDATEDLGAEMERIYGRDMAQFEDEWREWLLRLDLPEIEVGGSNTAKEIFGMEDPAYDDNGDGDYTYPLGSRYRPGMFDLTGFRVLEEKGRVYFELRYRDLVEWEGSSEWGFGGTFSRIAIDCGGHGGRDFGRDAHATVSGNCDYLINVSDYGVTVWSGGRVAGLLKRNPHHKNLGDPKSESVTFSIPSSVIEEPQKSWRYTVAVGCSCEGGKRLRDGVGGFLKVGRSASEETGGGGLDTDINPNIYDILLHLGKDQERILGSYDPKTGRLVALPMVGQ
jgi:hypothetical protein